MIKRLPVLLTFVLAACSEDPPPAPAPQPAPDAPSQAATMAATAPAPAKPTVTTGPRVLKVTGTALVDGAEAHEGMALSESAVIETKAASTVAITLFRGAVTQVRELTRVELGKNADFEQQKKKEWSLKLLAGAVWSFLPKGSSYEVSTQNAVAGARGTVYYVQATTADDTYICDCDGDIEVNVAGKKKALKSKMAHVSVFAKGAGKKAKAKPTKEMLGHDKSEIQGLLDLMTTAE
jgi:hypothetical protein